VVAVRYEDDILLGFQYRTDADRFLESHGNDWPSLDWSYTWIRRRIEFGGLPKAPET
jgi:hypothetical protein